MKKTRIMLNALTCETRSVNKDFSTFVQTTGRHLAFLDHSCFAECLSAPLSLLGCCSSGCGETVNAACCVHSGHRRDMALQKGQGFMAM